MAEKEDIDINDSNSTEDTAIEELDLTDQIEVIPEENDTVEPLIILQDEVVRDKAQNESGKQAGDSLNEAAVSSDPDDPESELSSDKTETENSPADADGQKDGKLDLDELDDDDINDLDDELFNDEPAKAQESPRGEETPESQVNGKSKKKSEESDESTENQEDSNDIAKSAAKSVKKSKFKIVIGKPTPKQIVFGLTLLLMSIAGGAVYRNPSLLGFKKEAPHASRKVAQPSPSIPPVQKKIGSPKPISKNERYLAKLVNVDLLRKELLKKKDEIHQLKQHYQDGIADLEDQIRRQMQKEGITSYSQALKNRGIELNLRTIQRRRSYIHRLEKPTQWLEQGREELLYLKRKAEFDFQLTGLAGGIDMDRHMRHISAAVQKYRPRAEKLAVDHESTDLIALETIWSQLKDQKKERGKVPAQTADADIVKEICAENYKRTAELTSMPAATARCLSKMTGSNLLLNNLTALSPAAAKQLCRWRGNWICINGLKKLSPAAAQYLFKWKGSWISLNGLKEFPTELATHLMEWEGKQLELMGLQYNNKNADQKALKYLALWETMGGKLFISDEVRKQLERVMM